VKAGIVRIDGGKDLSKRWVLSLDWKIVKVMDGESGADWTGEPRWEEWEEYDYEGEWLG